MSNKPLLKMAPRAPKIDSPNGALADSEQCSNFALGNPLAKQ